MKETLIEIKGVTKTFSHSKKNVESYALKDIHLKICRGDIYGIIGPSGAGKTTLMRCLAGLETPDQGTIVFNETSLNHLEKQALQHIRKQFGMVFQHFQLFSSRTVASNIAYPMEIQGVSKQEQQLRIQELLPLVGLEGKEDHYPAQLSGGEKQRVGIARALANHPLLLLCDEPTSALDPQTTRALLRLLQQLNHQFRLTFVIITHQLEVIQHICNRVAVLSKGEIVEEGNVQEIFSAPKHPVTRQLLHLDQPLLNEKVFS